MKMFNSKKQVQSSAIYSVTIGLIISLMYGIILINIILKLNTVNKEQNVLYILIIFILSYSYYKFFKSCFLYNLKILTNKGTADIFKIYGNPRQIDLIIKQIHNEKYYEDTKVIISNRFLYSKTNINDLCALKDILIIYEDKSSNKGMNITRDLVFCDKFGTKHTICYSKLTNEVTDFDDALKALKSRCKNAKIGYSLSNLNYVKQNTINLGNDYIPETIEEVIVDKELYEKSKIYKQINPIYDYDEDLADYYNDEEINVLDEEEIFEENILEVLKILDYDNYETFKRDIYEVKKISVKEFNTKKEECDYLVQALGYNDFYDFYESNVEDTNN